MKKIYLNLIGAMLSFTAAAQTPTPVQPYGKVDVADLELKQCDFEPDANAEVLFDKADVYFDFDFNVVNERHKRIKIFNDNGKKNADIRIEFYSISRLEYITGLDAQTINLVNGKPVITKIDKKQIFTEKIDKIRSALVFSLPNVKPGSVIEYRYKWTTTSLYNFPEWFFQEKIPVRYSELNTSTPEYFYYKPQMHIKQMFAVNKSSTASASLGSGPDAVMYTNNISTWGMKDVHSLPDEPFMSSDFDNLLSITFTLTQIRPPRGFIQQGADSWPRIGGMIAEDEDFGKQLKRKLEGEEALITKAKAMTSNDQKIAYLFNEVKNTMKWNGNDRWYTNDGTAKAWEKKSGNATEINLILYHLLDKAGVEALPMVVSTRDHGKVNPYTPFVHQFNRAVVMIPVDTAKYYILDASGKYNLYNEIPDNLLNSTGLYLNMAAKTYDLEYIERNDAVRRSMFVNAEIKPDGKVTGTTQSSLLAYNKIDAMNRFKTDGKDKYIEYLRNKDNNLKITSVDFENMDVDTLPLVQKVAFDLSLPGGDDNYIYFNPGAWSGMQTNPFIAENRFTDIEFGYRNNLFYTGMFKIPAGYKAETLPKTLSIVMPDKSITFKRIINATDQAISVRYVIDYSKVSYFKDEYPDLREFCRQMYEMINEPIALKKS